MHVAITGASSGIGAALARAVASATPGARLTLVARRRAELDALAAELGVPTHVADHDLADPARAAAWLAGAEAALGPVDVLVNNAGLMIVGPTDEVDPAVGERSVALNLLTPLRLIRAVLPGMRARGRGHIVNVTSMAGIAPTPSMTYYNAGKAGLSAASEALGGELRGSGVRVLTVYPGIIAETDLARGALDTYGEGGALALQPRATAAELARRVVVALARGDARLVYPRVYGLARHFPDATRWLLDRFTPPVRGVAS